jgi:Endonuclease/Exonuclease/phosphatase family 2
MLLVADHTCLFQLLIVYLSFPHTLHICLVLFSVFVFLFVRGKLGRLRDTAHDELAAEVKSGAAFANFQEPIPSVSFLPTYKKLENRPLPTNYKDPKWAATVYRTNYEEPWYKGGKVVSRVPSFCDRILYHSLGSTEHRFRPESRRDKRFGVHDNYCSVNEHLGGSDHSAIYGSFVLKVKDVIPQPIVPDCYRNYQVKIRSLKVMYGGADSSRVTLANTVHVLFPGPFEDGHDQPRSTRLLGAQIGAGRRSHLSWTGVELLDILHMQLRISTPTNQVGYTVLALPVEAFVATKDMTFTQPLVRYGAPIHEPTTLLPIVVEVKVNVFLLK